VALWAKGVELDLRVEAQREQSSHLCHRARCFNPDHVVVETELKNQRRKNCPVWVDCPHDDCLLKVRACVHEPMCVRHCEGFASHKEFVANGLH
jgi:Zinc-binding loop region of homing endonuclease